MNDSSYAYKYALIYSALVGFILLAPLFFYTIYIKNIHEIKNELLLKEKSLLILKYMEEYNQNDSYFEYPRFKSFESGLYDVKFSPIFSLIKTTIKNFNEGYHIDNANAYLIVKLPRGRYFDAEYLIVKNHISYASIYQNVTIVLLSITILIFMLSFFFLNRFARPFKAVNEKLDNFIKDSIHEINTPLAIINVNIDLYNRKHEPNKYMQRMKAAAKVLSNIYNDMDYLIKYETLDAQKESFDMGLFLKERIDYFAEVANMKHIQLQSSIGENIILTMNQKQFSRIVDNSISNAIKYSKDGNSIEILLAMQHGEAVLTFKDYGIGIENVDRIFHRYYREDTQKGGFGIGLNIVKSIIDAQNIRLEIVTKVKQGSSFIYYFPTEIIKIDKKTSN